jgi:hypothetical protein
MSCATELTILFYVCSLSVMHHPRCVINNKGTNEVISSNTTLFITSGSAQLHVSVTNIRHRQVVRRSCRIAISYMCSAVWFVWGGVCTGRDIANV